MKDSTVKRVLNLGASTFIGSGAVITTYGVIVPGPWTVLTGIGLMVTAAGVGIVAAVGGGDGQGRGDA